MNYPRAIYCESNLLEGIVLHWQQRKSFLVVNDDSVVMMEVKGIYFGVSNKRGALK